MCAVRVERHLGGRGCARGRKAYVDRRVAWLRIPCLHGSGPLGRVSWSFEKWRLCLIVSLRFELFLRFGRNLSVPVTCKVRLLDSIEDTINMCKMLVASGAR